MKSLRGGADSNTLKRTSKLPLHTGRGRVGGMSVHTPHCLERLLHPKICSETAGCIHSRPPSHNFPHVERGIRYCFASTGSPFLAVGSEKLQDFLTRRKQSTFFFLPPSSRAPPSAPLCCLAFMTLPQLGQPSGTPLLPHLARGSYCPYYYYYYWHYYIHA